MSAVPKIVRRSPIFFPPIINRLGLWLVSALLVITVSVVSIAVFSVDKLYSDQRLRGAERLSEGAAIISNRIDPVVSDLRFIARSNSMMHAASSKSTFTINRLEADWLNLAEVKGAYDQIRWIDENGMERVRVNFRNGEAEIVAQDQLQSKVDRYYFQKTITLQQGEIYVSPLDLNVENGVIEEPAVPVIRISTPVYNRSGASRGIVVVNYLAGPLLEQLRAIDPGNLWLLNDLGYWFLSRAPDAEWGFMYGDQSARLAVTAPDIWDAVTKSEAGELRNEDGFWLYRWLKPFSLSSELYGLDVNGADVVSPQSEKMADYRWLLVMQTPNDVLAAKIREVWLIAFSSLALSFAVILVSGWRIARANWREKEALDNLKISHALLEEKSEQLTAEVLRRSKAEIKLRGAVELYKAVLRNSVDSFLLLDRNGEIREANDAFCQLVGCSMEQVLGRNIKEFGFDEISQDLSGMFASIDIDRRDRIEAGVRIKGGEELIIEMNLVYLYQTDNVFAFMRNVTEHKIHMGELERSAYYDVLTGLPNRSLLTERMAQAISSTSGESGLVAILFIDLDGFKQVNDVHGHAVGDEVLITLAKRFLRCVRPVDTVGRLGGDEFVVLLASVQNEDACLAIVEELLAQAAKPVSSGGGEHSVTASIGVAYFRPGDVADPDLLLRRADHAMYSAKSRGRNCYYLAEDAFDDDRDAAQQRIKDLRHALENDEFELHYQPKVNAVTGQTVGAEALIRWRHPEKGLLYPAAFLPMIEGHPIYFEIASWVMRSAISQISEWNKRGKTVCVSINVSVNELMDPDFADRLRCALGDFPEVRPEQMELEVIETNELGSNDLAKINIAACKAIGVSISIDDFGTGYSSLSQLRNLSIDTIKIDRNFVVNATEAPDDLAILIAINSLARALDNEAVAEGVETEEQGRLLLLLGCRVMQGYFFARPMPAADFFNWPGFQKRPESWEGVKRIRSHNHAFLTAIVFHKAWRARLLAMLNGAVSASSDPVDWRACQFGRWLASEDYARFAQLPEMKEIVKLHDDLHEVADKACEAHKLGELGEVELQKERLGELSSALETLGYTVLRNADDMNLPGESGGIF